MMKLNLKMIYWPKKFHLIMLLNFVMFTFSMGVFLIASIVWINSLIISQKYKSQFEQVEYSIRIDNTNIRDKLSSLKTRDFLRYECRKMMRIGGRPELVQNAPHRTSRIDGAWFVCMDHGLSLVSNKCNVLSFGVNHDYSFDEEMSRVYACQVHSFDPFIETDLFVDIRRKNPQLANAIRLSVNERWNFYKLGLAGRSNVTDVALARMGDFLQLSSVLDLVGLTGQHIDMLKVDIEGRERKFFANLDMDFACKYIKQIAFESHLNMKFSELVKLERCFMLYHRDTRFFLSNYDRRHGHLSEFQLPTGRPKLGLDYFENELKLAEFMFVHGELYFVNVNFVNSDVNEFK